MSQEADNHEHSVFVDSCWLATGVGAYINLISRLKASGDLHLTAADATLAKSATVAMLRPR